MRSRVLLGLAWLVGTVASALVVWEGLSYEPESDRLRGSSVAGAVSGAGGATTTSGVTGTDGATGDGTLPGASTAPTTPVAISQVEVFTPGSASNGSSGTAPTVTSVGGTGTAPTTAPAAVGTSASMPVPPAPTTATAPPAGAPAPATESTFALVGGVAGVRFSATGVEVLWATPNAGFAVEIEPEGPGRKVEFRSGGHRSRLDVWWQDGPRHAISEKAD